MPYLYSRFQSPCSGEPRRKVFSSAWEMYPRFWFRDRSRRSSCFQVSGEVFSPLYFTEKFFHADKHNLARLESKISLSFSLTFLAELVYGERPICPSLSRQEVAKKTSTPSTQVDKTIWRRFWFLFQWSSEGRKGEREDIFADRTNRTEWQRAQFDLVPALSDHPKPGGDNRRSTWSLFPGGLFPFPYLSIHLKDLFRGAKENPWLKDD